MQLGDDVVVAPCTSTLAVRAAVWDHLDADDGRLLVVLTDVDDVGSEITARLYRHQLLHPESFEILKDLFRVTEVAQGLRHRQWLADLLVIVAPVGRTFAPPPGGVLDLETAWRALLLHGLGLATADPSLRDLLAWAAGPTAAPALATFSGEAITQVQSQLTDRLGDAAAWFVHLVRAGDAADVVPLGLIAAAATSPGASVEQATIARTHAGMRVGSPQPEPTALAEWGQAAESLVRSAAADPDQTAFAAWTARAGTVLSGEFGIPNPRRAVHRHPGRVRRPNGRPGSVRPDHDRLALPSSDDRCHRRSRSPARPRRRRPADRLDADCSDGPTAVRAGRGGRRRPAGRPGRRRSGLRRGRGMGGRRPADPRRGGPPSAALPPPPMHWSAPSHSGGLPTTTRSPGSWHTH